MTTTAEQMRNWRGPAILGFGFRPFFLLAGLWAAGAMAMWVAMLSGHDLLPTAFDPVSWHAHEFLFGYLGAVTAGFLLTAVPNWTGSLPVIGWPLAGLAGLWVLGRCAIAVSIHLPPLVTALADLALPLALGVFLAREIVAGHNWRNLPVLALLVLFLIANALFHSEAARGSFPAQGLGLRLGLAVAVMLISLIGGRVVPSFTRNWLAQRNATRLPTPFGRADGGVLALTALALAAFVAAPMTLLTAALAGLAGMSHLWRLARWQGRQTGGEALVWVLHAGYAFVPLGFLAVAGAATGYLPLSAALHVWLAGAVGLMSLAVMTRASLGHAGLPLHAGPAVTAVYLALIIAVVARLVAGIWPATEGLLHLAAGAWIAAFGGFVVIYWPIVTKPRSASKQPN
ncbi:NnrS family protein [Bauldia litoralis]|uniref:NnrS family protein n=1 Tax=Bauldia litoralis TaxID=665467 RepID=UPI0032631033